jgi:hypothetical protein
VPVVGKRSYKWWLRRQQRQRAENNFSAEFLSARVDANTRDEASIELTFNFVNLSAVNVEVDRLELHSLSIGGRTLQRRGDMLQLTGTVGPRSSNRLSVRMDLHGSDIRHLVQGIGKSVNAWSTPHVAVSAYVTLVCLTTKERFRKTLQQNSQLVECHVASAVAEALVNADGINTL